MLERSDRDKLEKYFYALKENRIDMMPSSIEKNFMIEMLQISDGVLEKRLNLQTENIYGIVMLDDMIVDKKPL